MGLFGCAHCEDMRQQRDRAQAQLAMLLEEQAALLKDVLAVKRHDLGLPPAGWTATNPLDALGPKTLAAIDLQGAGFTDLRGHLTNWALVQMAEATAKHVEREAADEAIAHRIRMGDTE